MKAVIIAAGEGSRLWPSTNKAPKTLLPYNEGTLLSTIMDNLSTAGINEFVLVVGFESEQIVTYLNENACSGRNITFVNNSDYLKGNGLSVFKAESAVGDGPFILSMCDHLVTPGALKQIVDAPDERNLLLVDLRVDDIFDSEDATRVLTKDERIVDIGKGLKVYNGIDCGIFKLNKRFFEAMRMELAQGRDSISAGIGNLIGNNDMAAVFLRDSERWLDVDTPEAYRYALDNPF